MTRAGGAATTIGGGGGPAFMLARTPSPAAAAPGPPSAASSSMARIRVFIVGPSGGLGCLPDGVARGLHWSPRARRRWCAGVSPRLVRQGALVRAGDLEVVGLAHVPREASHRQR